MCTFDQTGFKWDTNYQLVEVSSGGVNDKVINFDGGEGVFEIVIHAKEDSYETNRARQGGIKFMEDDLDIPFNYHQVTYYAGVLHSDAGIDLGSSWSLDNDYWIPHHWWSSSSYYPRAHIYPIIYRFELTNKPLYSKIVGWKSMILANNALASVTFTGASTTSLLANKLVINKYTNRYFTNLSVRIKRIREI